MRGNPSMSIKSEDPRKIHDGYKEAVVDSLLNNLAARVAGRDGYYKIIYGAKPSKTLLRRLSRRGADKSHHTSIGA